MSTTARATSRPSPTTTARYGAEVDWEAASNSHSARAKVTLNGKTKYYTATNTDSDKAYVGTASSNAYNYRNGNTMYVDDTQFYAEWSIQQPTYSKKDRTGSAAKKIENNKENILKIAQHFEIDPAILGGTIYVEQRFNYNIIDVVTDWVSFYGVIDMSVGLGQVRLSTAEFLENEGYVPKVSADDGGWNLPLIGFIHGTETMAREKYLENDESNIFYAAAYIRYFEDTWQEAFPTISKRPDILGSLYNLGHSKQPNPNPKSNEFGDRVQYYYDLMTCLLGL